MSEDFQNRFAQAQNALGERPQKFSVRVAAKQAWTAGIELRCMTLNGELLCKLSKDHDSPHRDGYTGQEWAK